MHDRCPWMRWAPTLKPSHLLETAGKEREKSHIGQQHDWDNNTHADDYKFSVSKLLCLRSCFTGINNCNDTGCSHHLSPLRSLLALEFYPFMDSWIHSFIRYILRTCHVSGLSLRGPRIEVSREGDYGKPGQKWKWDPVLLGCRSSHTLPSSCSGVPHSHQMSSHVPASRQIPFDRPSPPAIKR